MPQTCCVAPHFVAFGVHRAYDGAERQSSSKAVPKAADRASENPQGTVRHGKPSSKAAAASSRGSQHSLDGSWLCRGASVIQDSRLTGPAFLSCVVGPHHRRVRCSVTSKWLAPVDGRGRVEAIWGRARGDAARNCGGSPPEEACAQPSAQTMAGVEGALRVSTQRAGRLHQPGLCKELPTCLAKVIANDGGRTWN